MGRGRFSGENSQRRTHSLPIPRGRGQLSEYDKEKIDKSQFFKKEIKIKQQIELVSFLFFHIVHCGVYLDSLMDV